MHNNTTILDNRIKTCYLRKIEQLEYVDSNVPEVKSVFSLRREELDEEDKTSIIYFIRLRSY